MSRPKPYSPAPQKLLYLPKFDRRRGPDNPLRWAFRLEPPASVDRSQMRSLMRFCRKQAKDQGPEGSCTANAGSEAAETCALLMGITPVDLSRMELYVEERLDEGETLATLQDVGALPEDSIETQVRHGGLVAETDWPYDANPSEGPPAGLEAKTRHLWVAGQQPVDLTDNDRAIDAFLAGLDNLQPFVNGMSWYQEHFAQFQRSGVLSARPTSKIAGGHEIFGVGWIPATAGKPETGSKGLTVWLNSWGATSPARTDLFPDAIPGMVYIPAEALGGYVDELLAVVPAAKPASLTLSLSAGPAWTTGSPGALSATLAGAPAGSPVLYTWDFGDGAVEGGGPLISHVYRQPGSLTVRCVASVPTTGASAMASLALTVSGQPVPATVPCRNPALTVIYSAMVALNADYTAGRINTRADYLDEYTRLLLAYNALKRLPE